MLEGLYSAAAGMAAQQQRMDSLANDVANVNTAGYKNVRMGFRDLVYAATTRGANAEVTQGAGAAAAYLGRNFQQGALLGTGNATDLAIQGPGFFQVRTPEGQVALTRDGSFHVNENGRLVTANGAQVLPEIDFTGVDIDNMSIGTDGTVRTGTQTLGQITLVNVRSPEGLTSAGDNLYTATAESGPAVAATGSTIAGGYLEQSNVDLGSAMVGMMESQKAYQLASRAIRQHDEMAGIANGVKR
jgi:flagellar basal-body rod protein FlgG